MGTLIQGFHLKGGIHLSNLASSPPPCPLTILASIYSLVNICPSVPTIPLLSFMLRHQSHVTVSWSLTIIDDGCWIAACVPKSRRCVLIAWKDSNSSTWPAVSLFFALLPKCFFFYSASTELDRSLTRHSPVFVFCQQSWKGWSQVATNWDSFPGSFAFPSQV